MIKSLVYHEEISEYWRYRGLLSGMTVRDNQFLSTVFKGY